MGYVEMSEYRVDRFKAALREAKALLSECCITEFIGGMVAVDTKTGHIVADIDIYERVGALIKKIEELEKL